MRFGYEDVLPAVLLVVRGECILDRRAWSWRADCIHLGGGESTPRDVGGTIELAVGLAARQAGRHCCQDQQAGRAPHAWEGIDSGPTTGTQLRSRVNTASTGD